MTLLGAPEQLLDVVTKTAARLASAPDDTTKNRRAVMKDVEIEEEEIPDSLLHPRWPVQKTTPVEHSDLGQGSYDLQRPENMKQTVEYNDTLDRYVIGNKVGGTWVAAPIMIHRHALQPGTRRKDFRSGRRAHKDSGNG